MLRDNSDMHTAQESFVSLSNSDMKWQAGETNVSVMFIITVKNIFKVTTHKQSDSLYLYYECIMHVDLIFFLYIFYISINYLAG